MKRSAAVIVIGLGIVGCYPNSSTPFPEGLEPWETTNRAELPAAIGSDVCPETLVFSRGNYVEPDTGRNIRSVHARACIHQPIEAVFEAARDPQTGRDPSATQAFRVNAYDTEPDYAFSFQTHVTANTTAGLTPEFDINWRHGVVTESDGQMQVTASRWKKTFGSEAIELLEGSLVLMPIGEDPMITEVQYQYHLSAVTAGHETIESYLSQIYERLRQRSHGETLVPNDCDGCATAPAGY